MKQKNSLQMRTCAIDRWCPIPQPTLSCTPFSTLSSLHSFVGAIFNLHRPWYLLIKSLF